MASTETGEMFTQEEVDRMWPAEREKLGLVRITPEEEKILSPMSDEQRKQWLKSNKSKSRRSINKRERQNRRKARAKL